MAVPLKKQLYLLALLLLNHIASFVVTATLLIWFETVFPRYGEAPSLWIIVLPLRTAVLYTFHSIVDKRLLSAYPADDTACQKCQLLTPDPLFSLSVAAVFQVLFYEPRWICAVLGVSDEGPTCSLPQAIILEIPLGFTVLLLADNIRTVLAVRLPGFIHDAVQLTILQHGSVANWALAHCSARSLSLHLIGFIIAFSTAVSRYDRIWTLSMSLFRASFSVSSIVLLAALVQIESQLSTTVSSKIFVIV